jgi:hypothetical protein
VGINDWRAYSPRRRDHIRLVTNSDDPAAPRFEDDSGAEPLSPEVIASLVDLRERLKAKLFAPNMATRPRWTDIHPCN